MNSLKLVENNSRLKHFCHRRLAWDFIKLRFSSLLQLYSTWRIQSLSKKDLLNKHNIRYNEYSHLGRLIEKGTANLSVPYVTFKLMDYNILSHTHMLTHMQNYKNCPRECLNWDYRKSVLRDEFFEEMPDIFCLQEVEDSHKNELLEPLRKKGFDALFVPRGEGKPDGCALLYRTSMFWISDFYPIHYLRHEIPLLNRPNVGMVARLELKSHPGNYIVVANTHLLFNPRRTDIKLTQLQILLAETDRLAYNLAGGPNKYHPVVLTGDLNVKSNSGLINLLRDGQVNCCDTIQSRNIKSHRIQKLFPAESVRKQLKITKSCQYEDVLESRQKGLQDPRRSEDLEHILQEHRVCPDIILNNEAEGEKSRNTSESIAATNNNSSYEHDSMENSKERRFFPNSLNHDFSFINVYDHPELDYFQHERTYKAKQKLNVYDYMFYSCHKNSLKRSATKIIQPGELYLLSRLRLPSIWDYSQQLKSLPNFACGSDHLPLTATFLLPVQ